MRSLDPGRQLVLLDQGLPEPRSPPRTSRSASTSSAAVSRCPRGTVCQPSRPRGKASASASVNAPPDLRRLVARPGLLARPHPPA